ncbi:Dual specificity protein phosphatase 16 [Cichlidogyrus casuarinus]|uniref:protein-tyrosine-phosphatase n=1 Tax=Cichlidogyrus casuarinus TaxID=1844966 RepID=A0ABD2Q154_9PLAT
MLIHICFDFSSVDTSASSPGLLGLVGSPCGPVPAPIKAVGGPLEKPPSEVLMHFFLGCQEDAMDRHIFCDIYRFTHVLNVSIDGEKSPFVDEDHFLRIPIADNQNDRIIPHFDTTFQFLERVRQENGRVLVHCHAGISRSPTIAVAYLMRLLKLPMSDAFKYISDSREGVSPNFNFMGQLKEFENQLVERGVLSRPESPSEQLQTQKAASRKSKEWTEATPVKKATSAMRPSMLSLNSAKKRERPSFLEVGQKVPPALTLQPSPSEGKRSRISLTLPSPSTHLAHLILHSPTEPSKPQRPNTLNLSPEPVKGPPRPRKLLAATEQTSPLESPFVVSSNAASAASSGGPPATGDQHSTERRATFEAEHKGQPQKSSCSSMSNLREDDAVTTMRPSLQYSKLFAKKSEAAGYYKRPLSLYSPGPEHKGELPDKAVDDLCLGCSHQESLRSSSSTSISSNAGSTTGLYPAPVS